MAVVVPGPPALSAELALFHTTDPLLGNSPVLVFHGPASTIGATSSRIQVHVFTPAGIGSYSRLSVSPNSPFYSAVSNLPREEQGDEICRGLAFGLKKYFSELPQGVRNTWTQHVKTPSPGALFGDDHIAILATRMARIENIDDVVGDIAEAFCEQRLSWTDVDVVLPPGAIRDCPLSPGSEDVDDEQSLKQHYGPYAGLIASFGDVAFLPTSRMRRAPSKATAIGRSASFARHQKENVRKEMSELLATEESYVGRLGELQGLSGSIGADLKEKYQEQLEEVFSPAIEQILDINRNFLGDLRSVIQSTEAAAEEDIEASEDVDTTTVGSPEPTSDLQGVIALAKSLCEWFPRFADGYKEYLGAHAEASQTLRTLLRNGDSLAVELQEVSEQKMTSLLIEPVQRLPRYNLYIDSISKQLPARHPALKPLLKARDIITDICAENQDSEASAVVERLRSRTLGWPTDISVTGRLITAADYVELMPPLSLEGCDAARGILLVFTDGIILVEKTGSCKTTARSLLTELESGSLPTRSVESLSDTAGDLQFIRRLQLDAVQCTESHDGQALQILTFFEMAMGAIAAREPILDSCQSFRLENVYDGRASRLVEEISKARIESRFSEAERESTIWEFRATDPASDSLGLFCAIFDDTEQNYKASRNGHAEVRILVDPERHPENPLVGQDGLRTIVSVEPGRDGNWRVSLNTVDGHIGREHVETEDLVPAVRRKLATLAGTRLAMEKPSMTACMLERNLEILQSIGLQVAPKEGDDGIPQLNARERLHRPKSPKKLLSSFLSSVGPGAEPPNVLRKESRELMAFSTQSSLSRLPTTAPGKPSSRESRPDSVDAASTSFSSVSSEPLAAPIKKLEETFAAYILALQARKGNIVGKNLKMRLTADEALVNEVYNGLIEDPNMMVLAAQAPLDVLFASFEKFLNEAWKDNIGQILPLNVLQDISLKAESLFPRDFDEYFKAALGRLAPQNQRAFRSIIRLLAELLDGTGNDGDRGTLTACFAEVLITATNPHDYIALLDRFVDDTDTYFGEPVEETRHAAGSINTHKRARSVNSSSLTSNTSSLRRKFGFSTLSRENSKSEQESKVASVWRTLSKTSRTDASPHGSISRATLGRSQSIDDGRHLGTRPLSQDSTKAREHQFTETPSMPALGRPPSSHNLSLSTIGEHPSFIPTGPPRKKRRSSLSDLRSLETTPKREPLSAQSPGRPPLLHSKTEEKELPRSPPTSTPTTKSTSAKYGTPQASPRSRLPSSFRRDMSPGPSRAISPGPNRSLANSELPRPKTSGGLVEEVVITTRPTSNIPSLVPRASSPTKAPSTPGRTGLSERPGAGNIVKKLSPQADKITRRRSKTDSVANPLAPPPLTPHRKLRMQSPQKLRERLQNEQSSITAASNALQDELSKIGDELTSTSSLRSPMRGSRTVAARNTFSPPSSMDLAQRVLKMEGQLPKQVEELNARINTIQSDLSTSLNVSETKCKKLDELYREANAENEALYARFNDELSRVMKAVRGGEGVEEMKKKLRESQEEAAKLRRETNRLKRENVGLRAQLKE
ncbi:related to Rho guanyl nucleotide exchange factor [Lecanosticta acicola]|uniref:Related to Rho guanyl nucleotide exchange factor n=1 Tax=Lecanosticta acicola TaxID=111012 RepID=A0AAI9E7G7_9PEZI|nr:related to Rho guanyl nucleotide exchange factor [Lecanosticta acicola]